MICGGWVVSGSRSGTAWRNVCYALIVAIAREGAVDVNAMRGWRSDLTHSYVLSQQTSVRRPHADNRVPCVPGMRSDTASADICLSHHDNLILASASLSRPMCRQR